MALSAKYSLPVPCMLFIFLPINLGGSLLHVSDTAGPVVVYVPHGRFFAIRLAGARVGEGCSSAMERAVLRLSERATAARTRWHTGVARRAARSKWRTGWTLRPKAGGGSRVAGVAGGGGPFRKE